MGIPATSSKSKHSLSALGLLILVDAALGALGVDTASNRKLLLVDGAVDILLEYWILLNVLELSLEVLQAGSVRRTVGATAGVVEVEALILDFLAVDTPRFSSQPRTAVYAMSVLTIHPFQHRSSWPSWGQHRCGLTWQSSVGDAVSNHCQFHWFILVRLHEWGLRFLPRWQRRYHQQGRRGLRSPVSAKGLRGGSSGEMPSYLDRCTWWSFPLPMGQQMLEGNFEDVWELIGAAWYTCTSR